MSKNERYIFWSGGKDSTATICLCHELGIKIDSIVMSEVMFDHERNISGENPEHIKWVYEVAIPTIENKFGYQVIVLKDSSDYVSEFNFLVGSRTKKPERIGKKRGFFLGGKCIGNNRLKLRPIRQYLKMHKNCEQIVGIAIDETDRLEKETMNNKRSILAEQGITEAMTYDICRKYNLLSPIYAKRKRQGCWFCPNQSTQELAELKKLYPQLWAELKKLAQEKNTVSNSFKYRASFFQVEQQVNLINNQITFFELLS